MIQNVTNASLQQFFFLYLNTCLSIVQQNCLCEKLFFANMNRHSTFSWIFPFFFPQELWQKKSNLTKMIIKRCKENRLYLRNVNLWHRRHTRPTMCHKVWVYLFLISFVVKLVGFSWVYSCILLRKITVNYQRVEIHTFFIKLVS